MDLNYCIECGKPLTFKSIGDEGEQKHCSACNKFYFDNRILGEEEGVMQARLLVTKCTRDVIKTALGLLGIDAPEKM